MLGMNSVNSVSNVAPTPQTQAATTKDVKYGKTIGEPKLSETAAKYYEGLKKKFGEYDFILVSKDEMADAKANASKYANPYKTVVLIDEEKIERMATDEKYRKQYEGILSGATAKLQQMQASMKNSGADVKGYGMQVGDNGEISYFAVLRKSSEAQKERIEKKTEEHRAERKAAEKKAQKKKQEERLKDIGTSDEDSDDTETVTISANSIEDLMKKIADYTFLDKANTVKTESEMQLGQHIDFKG